MFGINKIRQAGGDHKSGSDTNRQLPLPQNGAQERGILQNRRHNFPDAALELAIIRDWIDDRDFAGGDRRNTLFDQLPGIDQQSG